MPSASAPALAFRPLVTGDLPRLHRWFHAPHARRWFGKDRSFQDLADEYQAHIDGTVAIHSYVVLADGRPVALVSWERFGDFPDEQALYRVTDPDASNCDIVIGEPDVVHRGLGPRILRAFLREIVFADPRITTCIIDPDVDNAIAIRCYEKLGFRFVRAIPDDGEGFALYLLELTRAELDQATVTPVAAAPYLRPGRADELQLALAIDRDACAAYPDFDPAMDVDLPTDHPFVRAETDRWARALQQQRLLFACAATGEAVGFAALDLVDGCPLLEQVSVRRAWMRQGIGRALLNRAQHWSVRPAELWLTTYAHVPWNRPWYERQGFVTVAATDCPPGIRAILGAERAALPRGDSRVAMVYRPPRA